ncbi:MAG: hypothetical protein NTV23_15785 [Propionibacteriales bacterium]|nr:hypothetical protein [Propionibacteriales bacterium]
MSENLQIGEVLEGYAEATQELVAEWTPYLTGLSGKATSGSYGPTEVADEFPALVQLVAASLFKLSGQAVRTVEVLSSDLTEAPSVDGYVVAAQKVATTLTLKLKGDLVSVTGEVLPMKQVTLVPDHVVAPADFDVVADGNGFKARTYDGMVLATDPTGALVQEIFVSVSVG